MGFEDQVWGVNAVTFNHRLGIYSHSWSCRKPDWSGKSKEL